MNRSILSVTTALAAVMTASTALAAGQPETDAVWIDPGYVQLGETLTGTLAEGDSHTVEDGLMDRFVMDLTAGTRVEVVMRSSDFDTYLIAGFLGAEGYEQIALDDDGLGEGLNSRMVFTAAETGRYEIRARSFAGAGEGAYTLAVSEAPGQPAPAALGSLVIGGSADGTLSTTDATVDGSPDQYADGYRFHAEAGDIVEAVARSSEFDTTLTIQRDTRWGQTEYLGFDDDGLGEGTNSRLRLHVEEGGDYTLTLSSYSAGEVGAYRLELNRVEPWPAATPIDIGSAQSGTISNTDPTSDDGLPFDAYSISVQAGQRLEIVSQSVGLSTFAEVGRLSGPAGWDPLAYGEETNDGSRLLFSPEEGGDYIVRVNPTEMAMRGDYTMTIRDRGPLPPPPPPGSIGVGDSLTGTLVEGDGVSPDEKYFDEYDVRTTVGQRLSISQTSTDFDSYVEIYGRADDGTYDLITSDDDGGGDLNSRAGLTTDRRDYRIRVTSFSAGATGSYQLSVRDLGPVVPPRPLTMGRPVEGSISDADALTDFEVPYDSYGFSAQAGQRLRFTARSDDFDTLLIVTRAQGDSFEVMTYDDDGAGDGSTNSRAVFVADEAGSYELWVLPYDPTMRGNYTLDSTDLGPAPTSQPIVPGSPVTGVLQDGDGLTADGTTYDGFTFEASAGQRFRADMSSDVMDAFLLVGVHGPDGLADVAQNDDAPGQGTNASVTFTAATSGTYEVWATTFSPGETGTYSLTLTDLGPEPEPGSLLVGSTVRGSLSDQDPVGPDGAFYDAYRFTAQAGETVRITATSNAIDSYLELGRMDGRTFTIQSEDDDSLSDLNSLITFTPETTDTYVVRVRSFSPGETGDYVLTIEDSPAQ